MAKKKVKKKKSTSPARRKASRKKKERISMRGKSSKKKRPASKRITKKSKKSKQKKKSVKKRSVRKKSVRIKKKTRKTPRKKPKKKLKKKKLVKKKKLRKKKTVKKVSKKPKAVKPAAEIKKPKKIKKVEAIVDETVDRTAMHIYLKQIEKIPLLTPNDEVELSKAILSKAYNAKKSRERMIRSNLRLVISIAKRYTNLGLQFSDLVEEGNIGLMRAVEKFNWERGYRFSTYASWWIKQAIMRSISNHGKTIRIPVYMFDTISKFRKVKDNMTQKLGRIPTNQELAQVLKCTPEKIEELGTTISSPSSLNAPLSIERSAELIDVIADRTAETPHKKIDDMFKSERVQSLLAKLDDRSRQILSRRYGIGYKEPQTLEQIAQVFNITRERVRQIEVLAVEKIREHLKGEAETIADYV